MYKLKSENDRFASANDQNIYLPVFVAWRLCPVCAASRVPPRDQRARVRSILVRERARRALRGLENTTPSLFSPSKLKVRTLMGLEGEDASFASVVALSIALAAGSVPSLRLSVRSVVAIILVLSAPRLSAATAAVNLPVGPSRC